MGRRTTVVTGRGCPPGTRAPLGASRPWKLERFSFGFRGRLDSGRSSSPGQQNENLCYRSPMSMGGRIEYQNMSSFFSTIRILANLHRIR